MLGVSDHSRDSAGMKYVYPVVSRRAGGVSVGVNLNVNNACNWACVYCQVPNLKRGGPPPVDLELLEGELRTFLERTTSGDFMEKHVPEGARRLVDVAFSGNGEPTSAAEFAPAVGRVALVLRDFGLVDTVKIRLITNGSLMHRPDVCAGIADIGTLDGEVWFKVDRATSAGTAQVNKVNLDPEKVRASLLKCAELAPTWVQTCYFAIDGDVPDAAEQAAYLELIASVREKIRGVHLYGLARPSMQPDAEKLSKPSLDIFHSYAKAIASLGVKVVANP